MLEILPTSLRSQILDEPAVSRCYPTLEHPRLAHDQVKVSCLKTILSKTKGITLVQGERETLVTFLLTALGHSGRVLSTNYREVLGLDSHAPDWFVPIPGVTTSTTSCRARNCTRNFEKAWPRMSVCQAGLLILMAAGRNSPRSMSEIHSLGRSCHVV